MRIALVHRRLSGGGTEADLRVMAAGLAERGHEVHVFCTRGAGAPAGVQVRRVPDVRAGRVVRLLAFAIAAPRLVARERWDVVMGFGRIPRQDIVRVGGGTHRSYLARMEAAGLRRRGRGPYHRAILWLERRQFAPGAYRRVLAVSRLAAAEVARDYGVPPGAIAVVYNGVDLERFHPRLRATRGAALRAALAIGADEPLCVAVGTGFARKGIDLLFALWARADAPPARLLVVGDDERLRTWKARADGRRVLVTGPRADVDAVFAAADVAIVPSRQEAFGNVVLEACAAGVPVVTSRQVGAAELLAPPLDALVIDDPTELEALRAAVERALGSDGRRLGRAARARAERLPWAEHLDRVEALCAEVARAR